jgi:hypothetical protein
MRGTTGVGDFIRGIKEFFVGSPTPAAASEPLPEGAPPPSEKVTGSTRINNDKRLAIAFELKNASNWRLPERVTVELADGSTLRLEVDQKHGTASGNIAAGVEIRLVCRLDAKLPSAPVRLSIEYQDEPGWLVELGA